MTYIRVHSGAYVNLVDPDIDDILLEDIAHALSNIGRYTGHTSEFYSVAQHSILAAYAVVNEDTELARAMLFHDAHEAYLGDISSPLKRLIGSEYDELTEKFDRIISQKFDVDLTIPSISVIDRRMGLTEADQLLDADIENGFWPTDTGPFDISIVPWEPESAERAFYSVKFVLDLAK